ncbi:MAG: RidA family protein [Burkholderiales bacterium]|jgi:enamine deaminase RidA (YjgF/YER057c/UK114 family)|nr:RidA family protein [Burkholderiales bacterium]
MTDIKRYNSDKRLSRAVVHGNMVYLAGITADDRSKGMRAQTAEILAKIDALLKTAGTDKSKLLSATIWISDMRAKPEMDEAWAAWADQQNLPARACVEARLGSPDTLVEIMVQAAK